MTKILRALLSLAVFAASALVIQAQTDKQPVTLVHHPDDHRIDVLVGRQPFTSYRYPPSLQKPVLHPIRSAKGLVVTRGYPLDPKPGERADHPHHVGHWFNYGDVNGFDFWGHSDATPEKNKPKMGTIVHREVTKLSSGSDRGELGVRADWILPDGSTLLREETNFVFSGGPERRVIDRTTTWTAGDKPVTFNDTKEGAFGIRVARALDHPSKSPETLVAADGKSTEKRAGSAGAAGRYIGSDGKTGEEVWGTRGPWMGLTGTIEDRPVTLAIFDHPKNPNHPTYWHARGYGLFAANPLGRQGYDPKQPPTSLTLKPGESVTFRHRILVEDSAPNQQRLQQEYERYVGPTEN